MPLGIIFYGVKVSKKFINETNLDQIYDDGLIYKKINNKHYLGVYEDSIEVNECIKLSDLNSEKMDKNFLNSLDKSFDEDWGDELFKSECYEKLKTSEKEIFFTILFE